MVAALLRPWREARTWRELAHLCTDWLVGTISFTVVVTLLATSLGLAIVAPLAVPVVWLLFTSAQLLGRVERSRLSALLDLDVATSPPPAAGTWWGRFVERLKLDRVLPRIHVDPLPTGDDLRGPDPENRHQLDQSVGSAPR